MADKTEKKPGFVARMKAAVKNFVSRVAKFFRDAKSELKKVVWPSKADVKSSTGRRARRRGDRCRRDDPAGHRLWRRSEPDHRRMMIS